MSEMQDNREFFWQYDETSASRPSVAGKEGAGYASDFASHTEPPPSNSPRTRHSGRPKIPFTAPTVPENRSNQAARPVSRSAYTGQRPAGMGLYGSSAYEGYGVSGQNRTRKNVPYDYSNPNGGFRQKATFTELPFGADPWTTPPPPPTEPPGPPAQDVPPRPERNPETFFSARPAGGVERPVAFSPSYRSKETGPSARSAAPVPLKSSYRGAGAYPPDQERARAIARQYQEAARGRSASDPRPSSGGSRKRAPGGPPLLTWILLFAAVAFLLFLVIRLAARGGSSGRTRAEATQAPLTVAVAETFRPSASETADPAAAPEPTPMPTATPEPTPEPTGPKALVNDAGLIVPADWGVVIPKRKTACYDSFFDKSCIIGNSMVEGFFMWSGLTNLRYIYDTGATVQNVLGKMDLSPITMNEGYYTDIYLMFGLNEVGSDVQSFLSSYRQVVAFIRQYQPKANIIVISITPITKAVDADPNEPQSMERINNFNAALKDMCAKEGIWYLDIYSLLLDGEGYLSANYAFAGDGKHFEKSGYVAWANYMREHYVDAALATE